MIRHLTFVVLSICFGLVVVSLGVEIGLRTIGYTSDLIYLPNPHYGWSHTPDSTFTRKNVDGSYIDIHINPRGLRDYDYKYGKPPRTFRILILGDSFTEALQVPLSVSFTKRIENRLNTLLSDHPTTTQGQVLNAGASGYGTDNALLFYKHEGYKYDPDLVILAFYIGNDIRNNLRDLELIDAGGDRKPYYALETEGLVLKSYPFEQHDSLFTRFKSYLNQHTKLYSFLRQSRDRLRHLMMKDETKERSKIPLDLNLFLKNQTKPWHRAVKITKCLISELNREVIARDGRLLLVLIPTQFQVHPKAWEEKLARNPALRSHLFDLDAPNNLLSEYLYQEKIPFINLLPNFRERAADQGEYYYIKGDGHWNSNGHELAGNLITNSIKSYGFLRKSKDSNHQVRNVPDANCLATDVGS